jgi:hypothetical protein
MKSVNHVKLIELIILTSSIVCVTAFLQDITIHFRRNGLTGGYPSDDRACDELYPSLQWPEAAKQPPQLCHWWFQDVAWIFEINAPGEKTTLV